MDKLKDLNNIPSAILKISVIYDNYPMHNELQTDWGFASIIEIGKNKILFDTGGNGQILLNNMKILGIDPQSIGAVILSHFHHDHTGGLNDFLEINSRVIVYYPKSFPKEIIETIKSSGAISIPVSDAMEIMPDVYTLGEIEGKIPEQSLAIRSPKGIIVITGCAHPGIVNIIEKARIFFPEELISLALGGFHFFRSNADEINESVQKIFALGICSVAPTHCSGDIARTKFKEIFANAFVEIGAGKVVNIV